MLPQIDLEILQGLPQRNNPRSPLRMGCKKDIGSAPRWVEKTAQTVQTITALKLTQKSPRHCPKNFLKTLKKVAAKTAQKPQRTAKLTQIVHQTLQTTPTPPSHFLSFTMGKHACEVQTQKDCTYDIQIELHTCSLSTQVVASCIFFFVLFFLLFFLSLFFMFSTQFP